ncbi:SPD1B-like protein, partial [Mya arenaria]
YLIAMVFAYFKRAGYKIREYTRMNFFVALYLANDMEEDEEELKYEIFPWALGDRWRDKFSRFLLKRDNLWARIDHRAVVSRCCCDQIMAIEPEHPVWTRLRPDHHAGAQRGYLKGDDDDGYPRGPGASPRACQDCDTDSVYDSASPLSVSWYISSGQTSPNNEDLEFFEKLPSSTFDMIGH